jgi:hypothetical protein
LPALEMLMPQTGNKILRGINDGLAGHNGDPLRIMIVGFDYDRNRGTYFRSTPVAMPCLGVTNAADITLAEAIHASTNAPVNYFDGAAVFPERTVRYWDGGITGNNNPVLAAVTEARVIGKSAQEISALSLGTGTVQLLQGTQGQADSPYYAPWRSSGLAADINKMASSILDDPPDAASFLAHVMTLGGALPAPAVSRIVRMNPVVAPVEIDGQLRPPGSMTVAQFQYLCNLGMDALTQTEVNAISTYAELWLSGQAPNQLIHTDGGTPLPMTIGYGSFSAALAAWEAIK